MRSTAYLRAHGVTAISVAPHSIKYVLRRYILKAVQLLECKALLRQVQSSKTSAHHSNFLCNTENIYTEPSSSITTQITPLGYHTLPSQLYSMSESISRLLTKATGGEQQDGGPTHTILFCTSETELDLVTVHHSSHPKNAPPIFTIKMSESMGLSSKSPDYLFLQQGQVMGEAGISSSLSKVKLSLRGRPIQMKTSQISGNFSLEVPPLPPMKWKPNKLTMGSLELCDESGKKLAKIKKSSLIGGGDAGQTLEIYVPCDDFFVDLCVVSGFAAWTLNRTNKKIIEEVLTGGGGA